jgi:hypothetical protein
VNLPLCPSKPIHFAYSELAYANPGLWQAAQTEYQGNRNLASFSFIARVNWPPSPWPFFEAAPIEWDAVGRN